jgi:hypothetical protein
MITRERAREGEELTIELLENTLNGSGAAAAAHGDVELVCVGHAVGCGWRYQGGRSGDRC